MSNARPSRCVALVVAVLLATVVLPVVASDAAPAEPSAPPSLLTGLSDRHAGTDAPQGVERSRLVLPDTRLLDDPVPTTLTLDLVGGVSYVARVEPAPSGAPGWASWRGHLVGVPMSDVTLVRKGTTLSGVVVSPRGTYVIRYDGRAHHVDAVQGPARPREDLVVSPPKVAAGSGATRPPAATAASPATVDVLVAYTPAAEAAVGGASAMQSLIATAIATSNNSYTASDVHMSLRLVGTHKTFAEGTTSEDTLGQLESTTDGTFDELHSLRNATGADLVSLLVPDGDFCGISIFPTSLTDPAASSVTGFSLVESDCAVDNFSFPHELGHNLSAAHDHYVTSSNPFFPQAFGYVNTAAKWRTVMAYDNQCQAKGFSCTRLPRWSNPAQKYQGAALGVAGRSDNQDALNGASPTIAEYRTKPAKAGSVKGSVRTSDGTGVAHVRVRLSGGLASGLYAITDASGNYVIGNVPFSPSGQHYLVRAGLCVGPAKSVSVDGTETANFTVAGVRAAGYTCTQRAASHWIDGATRVTALDGQEDESAPVALPFRFDHMGTKYAQVHVATNGLLSFAAPSSEFLNGPLPSSDEPNAAIYPFWDDLTVDPSAAVYTATSGTSPNRRFAIEWRNVKPYWGAGSERIDVEVVLGENGHIWFEYRAINPADPVEAAGTATIGIENAAGDAALQASFDDASVATGTSVELAKAPK